MAHIGLLDVDITPVDMLSGIEREALKAILGSDLENAFFGTVKQESVAIRIKIDYRASDLVTKYGYRIGDSVGVTVTSDTINNSSFYEVKLTKYKRNSVNKVIGNLFDEKDYLIAIIPTTSEKVNFYFTQNVKLGNAKIRAKNPPQNLIEGTATYTIDMSNYVSKPSAVDSFTIDPIYLTDSWDNDNLYAKMYWTHNYNNSEKKLYDRILWYDIYCESSLLGSIKPVRVYYNNNNTYVHNYKLPGLLLQEHMRKVYEETNITQETIQFSIITVKAGLINSTKRKYTTTLYYKRPIYVNDMWIRSGLSSTTELKIYNDMTYTALANSGKYVWDDRGDKYDELVLRWTVSEKPKNVKVKVYTYFGALSAKLDIFRVGKETDITDKPTPDKKGIYSYSYPAYLNRTAFEHNGTISGATDYDETVSKNCTRFVAFEVTVEDDKGNKSKKRSQVIKIERRPIIRYYTLKDTENGTKYYNYENGFNFNFYNAVNNGNLENAEISWGIDRVTLAEWLGIDINKENKSFGELVSLYTENFFKNILTTYERTRNILSPVWFEMYLVIKSDYYFDIIEKDGDKYITLVSPFDHNYVGSGGRNGLTINSDGTHTPEYEYLIDSYDKDFMDWLLSVDHQHHITVDKNKLAFYEDTTQESKLRQVVKSALIKRGYSESDINFNVIKNTATLRHLFRRLIDVDYATFRLYQFEYMPSIYLQRYPVHWECPVCNYKFVVSQMDNTGTLYVFDGDNPSSYYKSSEISSQAICNVGGKFNTFRSARKYYKCPKCGYTPNDYELDTTPKWLQTLTGIDVGLPIIAGTKTFDKYGKKSYFDLYDYNNRLDKMIMGLFYAGTNTTVNSYKVMYQVISQLFSGDFDGDAIETMLKTSEYTNATKTVNTSGIATFKELFSAGSSYINEFRDYYRATCQTCGHTLYLDVLYTDGQKIKCPYCFSNNIKSAVKNGSGNMSIKDIGMAWQNSTSTVSDTDFINFYHRMGTLDLDSMVHYCPNGKITVLSPNTNSETQVKTIRKRDFGKEPIEFNMSWKYAKTLGKLSGFTICIGLSAIDRQWYTVVNELNKSDKSKSKFGMDEILTVPLNSANKSDVYYYMIDIDYNGQTSIHSDDYLYDFVISNSKDSITFNGNISFDLNLALNKFIELADFYGIPKKDKDGRIIPDGVRASSLMSDDLKSLITDGNDGIKLSFEIRPYYEIKSGNSKVQRLYGKSRKYKKHDASNFDGSYTDYGEINYISSFGEFCNLYLVFEIEPEPGPEPPDPTDDSKIAPVFPNPYSTNIYNVTPAIDEMISVDDSGNIVSPYTGNFHWVGPRNASLVYELNFSNTYGSYNILDEDDRFYPIQFKDKLGNLYDKVPGKELNATDDYYEYTYALTKVHSSSISPFDANWIYSLNDVVSDGDDNLYECRGIEVPCKYTIGEIDNPIYWSTISIDNEMVLHQSDYSEYDRMDISEYPSSYRPYKFIDSDGNLFSTVANKFINQNTLNILTSADYELDDIMNTLCIPNYKTINSDSTNWLDALNSVAYSDDTTYDYGDFVTYNGYLYKYIGAMNVLYSNQDHNEYFSNNSAFKTISNSNVYITRPFDENAELDVGMIVYDVDSVTGTVPTIFYKITNVIIDEETGNVTYEKRDLSWDNVNNDVLAFCDSDGNPIGRVIATDKSFVTYSDLVYFCADIPETPSIDDDFYTLEFVDIDDWQVMTKYHYNYFYSNGFGSDMYVVTEPTSKGHLPVNNTAFTILCSISNNDASYYGYCEIMGLQINNDNSVYYVTNDDVLYGFNGDYELDLSGNNVLFVNKYTDQAPSSGYYEIIEFSEDTKYAVGDSARVGESIIKCKKNLCRYSYEDLQNTNLWTPISGSLENIQPWLFKYLSGGKYYLTIKLNSDFLNKPSGEVKLDSVYALKAMIPFTFNYSSGSLNGVLESDKYTIDIDDSGEKQTKTRPDLNIHFIDPKEQEVQQGDTIFADVLGTDSEHTTKYCPKCERIMTPKVSGKSLYYHYSDTYISTEIDETYDNPVQYDKLDTIRREVVKDVSDKYNDVNSEFNNSFDGVHCIECGTELIDTPTDITNAISRYRGSYWVARQIEAFNGYFGYHTPTHTDIMRGKDIKVNPYEFTYSMMSKSRNEFNKYLSDDIRNKMCYNEVDIITIPQPDDEVDIDTALDKTESELINSVLGQSTSVSLHRIKIKLQHPVDMTLNTKEFVLEDFDYNTDEAQAIALEIYETYGWEINIDGYTKDTEIFTQTFDDRPGELFTKNVSSQVLSTPTTMYPIEYVGDLTDGKVVINTSTPINIPSGTKVFVVKDVYIGESNNLDMCLYTTISYGWVVWKYGVIVHNK